MARVVFHPEHPGFRATFALAKTWPWWRTVIVLFCAFSVLGHFMEYPYCWIGLTFFDSVDPNNEVLTNPLKPFFVYGIGLTIGALVLVPYKEHLRKYFKHTWQALLVFFVISVFIGMAFELAQGFLQNQPDENGVYPLWDVHDLPGNILGQAWIVNDLFLGLVITFATWVIYPYLVRQLSKLSERSANINMIVVVAVTAALTIYTYFLIQL